MPVYIDNFHTLAFVLALICFEAEAIGLIIAFPHGFVPIEALLIIAFVLYTIGVMLVAVVRISRKELTDRIAVVSLCFLIFAALISCSGVAGQLIIGRFDVYSVVLLLSAAVVAIVVSVLLVVRIVVIRGVALRSSESSRTNAAATS